MYSLAEGSKIGDCRIDGVVGRGGMGVVYRATQLGLERQVALKVIAPEFAVDDEYRQRFKRESRLAASIDHPNVIPVYEAGELDGVLYLVMRFADGTDLRSLLRAGGRLAPQRALSLVIPIGSALAAAHRRGLVHRDVKPANVLVTWGAEDEPEHVYLTDFGIARQTSSKSSLTREGLFAGTLDYAAPELIHGGRGDARSDIYAFGCMLYEALTGTIPFDRPSDVSKMFAHVNDPVPAARATAAEVLEVLDAIIARAMAKAPEDRFASASDLNRALGHAMKAMESAAFTSPVISPLVGSTTRRSDIAVPGEKVEPVSASDRGAAAAHDLAEVPNSTGAVSDMAALVADGIGAPRDATDAAVVQPAAPVARDIRGVGERDDDRSLRAGGGVERQVFDVIEGASIGEPESNTTKDGFNPGKSGTAQPRAAPAPSRPELRRVDVAPYDERRRRDGGPSQRGGTNVTSSTIGASTGRPGPTKTSKSAQTTKIAQDSKGLKTSVGRRSVIACAATAVLLVVGLSPVFFGGGPSGAAIKRKAGSGLITIGYTRPWRVSRSSVAGGFAFGGAGSTKTGTSSDGSRPIQLILGRASLAGGLLRDSSLIPGGAPPLLVTRYGRPAASANALVADHPGRKYTWRTTAGEQLVAYVLPLTTGDAAILCQAPLSGAVDLGRCGHLAQRAIVSALVLMPGPDATLGRAIRRILAPVASSRTALNGLAGSNIAARAPKAARVATVEQHAASYLKKLRPPGRYQQAVVTLASAITNEASAFTALADAARADKRTAYSGAVSSVFSASRSSRAATRTLAAADDLSVQLLTKLRLDGPPAEPAGSAQHPLVNNGPATFTGTTTNTGTGVSTATVNPSRSGGGGRGGVVTTPFH
jgi:serine/threonine protein kinase